VNRSAAMALALAREANRLWEKCKGEVGYDCPSDEEMAAALLKIIEKFNKQQG
jgi:hypothetical protein